MKNTRFLPLFLLVAAAISAAFCIQKTPPAIEGGVKWLTWNEAMELQKTAPKKIMIDVYTDWCGWCKKMDSGAFSKAEVGKFTGDNFYCVKFDAEQKTDIEWGGQTFKYVLPEGQKRGIHTLAYSLLDGKMGYPSLVYLNEKMERIMISPGFKEKDDLLLELKFAHEEIYKTKSWEDFKMEK